MINRVHTPERPPNRVGVPHLAPDELDLRVKVVGPRAPAVNLRDEAVEHADAVAPAQKFRRHVRAHKARAARD